MKSILNHGLVFQIIRHIKLCEILNLYMRIFHTIKIQAKIKRAILKWSWQQRNYIDKKAIVNKFYSIK